MRKVEGFTLLAAITLALPAQAADWYTGVPTDGPQTRPPTAALDVVADGVSQRAFSGAVIGTIAPYSDLETSGLRLRIAGLGGVYRYNSTATLTSPAHGIEGRLADGAAMVGYEWVTKTTTVAGYVGAEIVNNHITPDDPNNTVKGTRGGLRIGVDAYVTPSDQTMLSGVAYYSTNNSAYYARGKFGMAIGDRVYIGPEVAILGDNFFRQMRIGGHVSGVRFGALQLGVATGFMSDRVRGSGAYGTLESRLTF